MEFKKLKTTEILSLILIFSGLIIHVILQVLLYVLYFYIPAVIVGVGFILFGISKLIENSRVKNKVQKSYEGMRFFHDRPAIIAILSLIIGLVFSLGEWFYQYGSISSINEFWLVGVVLRAVKIIVLIILISITSILSLYYKKNEKNKMLLLLPEILLIITILASFVILFDIFSYECYLLLHAPSCFPLEYYTLTTAFIILIALYFMKLLYVYQLRENNVSRLEQEYLEDRMESLQEDGENELDEKPTSIRRLMKESFSAETYSVWKIKWKYNQKKHFITRFVIMLVVSIPLFFGVFFLTQYILNSI